MIRIFMSSRKEILTVSLSIEEVQKYIEDNELFYVEEEVKGVYLVVPSQIVAVLDANRELAKVVELRPAA